MKKRSLLIPIVALPTILTIAGCASKPTYRTIVLDDIQSEIIIHKNNTEGIECTIKAKSLAQMVSLVTVVIGEDGLTLDEYNFEISTGKLSIPKETLDKYAGSVVIRPVLLTYFGQMKFDYTLMLINTVDCTNVDEWLGKLKDDGKGYLIFNDLDYEDKDPANWQPLKHIQRGVAIAVDAIKKGDSEQLYTCVLLAGHWLDNQYENSNWWQNEIGVPRDLSDLSMFVYDYLTYAQQQELIKRIRRGSLLYNKEIPESRKTGTNLFWYSDISMKDSWLTEDYEEFDLMFTSVSNEIKENEEDGFQSDGSYYQHGHQLYNGGYGRQGAILLAKIMSAFANTPIQWPDDKLEIIVNFLLKGLATTIHHGYTDYSTMGRTYCRKQANHLDGGTTDLGNVTLLKYVGKLPNCPHKDEVNKVIKAWEDKGESLQQGTINYLSRSNFISMNIDGIYISFKGTNAQMRNAETVNKENVLGYNLSYGTSTCVMDSGKEYDDITPVCDYASIPGTTALNETDEQLYLYSNSYFTRKLEGTFNGGTDKGVTISMQSTTHENTHYTVTCFATQYGMVLVGSDLTSTDGNLHTTVEQCIYKDGATPTISADAQTVTNGNVVYTNLNSGDTFYMKTGPVTGSWNRNNKSFPETDTETKNILKVTIVPSSGTTINKYAYCIQPKTQTANKFELIVNDENKHAIKLPDGKIAAAFYADSTFIYGGKTYEGKKGEYKVW